MRTAHIQKKNILL